MLKQHVALLAPFALIVASTACGGASSTTGEDGQGQTQANKADNTEQVATSQSDLRPGGEHGEGAQGGGGERGGVVPGGGERGGERGGVVPGGGERGGERGGVVPGGGERGGERGGVVPGGGERGGERGGVVPGEGERGGERGGVFGGRGERRGERGEGFRHGWVNGRWAPGWGWSHGQWIVGGGDQYTCVSDPDCAGPLGPGVAICSYDPTVALGYCIAPNW